jgi:hypothetical protein
MIWKMLLGEGINCARDLVYELMTIMYRYLEQYE